MSNGEPIIIKGGGSIEVRLSKKTFPADKSDGDKHHNAERRITGVTITDDVTDQVTVCSIPARGKFTIRVDHG